MCYTYIFYNTKNISCINLIIYNTKIIIIVTFQNYIFVYKNINFFISNIFRTYFDGQGRTRESDFHIKDNLFQVLPELIYLIIRGEEKIAVDNYVFISPIIENKKWIGETELEHVGFVKYTNDVLLKLGINVGDKIAFGTDCEYEFNIDNERLYRMRTSRILAKLEN